MCYRLGMATFVLDQAVKKLEGGDVVAIPTETVYGLAARVDLPEAVKKIFTIKQRPFFDPLIVHVSSKKMAAKLTSDWSPLADYLVEHFWPGPLTLVLPKTESLNPMITSGLETVGLRMPKHTLALSLIDRLGIPLAAPSANRFGKTSPTTAEHVRCEFPGSDLLVLDGGPCEVGLESTVLSIQRKSENENRYQLSILRAGAVKLSDLQKALSYQKFEIQFVESLDSRQSPGNMRHHYMPEIPLILVRNERLSEQDILLKAQEKMRDLPDQVAGVKLIKPKNFQRLKPLQLPQEAPAAARCLYSELRAISNPHLVDLLYFVAEPRHRQEEWLALMDRLTKASSLIID